jgi:hypothetical protein
MFAVSAVGQGGSEFGVLYRTSLHRRFNGVYLPASNILMPYQVSFVVLSASAAAKDKRYS